MSKFKDFSGMKFGKLKVIEKRGKTKQGNSIWLCKCDCGKEKLVKGGRLTSGNTKSCGCLRENCYGENNPNFRHGHRINGNSSKEFIALSHIIQRCCNQKDKNYHQYGGRGIKVCEAWLDKKEGYKNFIKDVGPCPGPEYSIDRIDTNGNYELGNVRWVTQKEQTRNTRRNYWIEFRGERKILQDWADILSVRRDAIKVRLEKGQSFEDVLKNYSINTRVSYQTNLSARELLGGIK